MQATSSIRKKILCLGLFALFFWAAAVLAEALSPDVGLVTKFAGDAAYWDKGKKPAPVQAFMKMRRGDHFKLTRNGSLTLLYFANGRQETWQGPVILTAGEKASSTKGSKKAPSPEVKMMPVSAIQKIAAAPFLLPRAEPGRAGATAPISMPPPGRAGATMTKSMRPPGHMDAAQMAEKTPGRAGAIQTMAPAPVCAVPKELPPPETVQKEIKNANAVYQDLKKSAKAGDFTPELYFLGVLAEYRQFNEMNKILDGLLQQKPGDPALKKLQDWVKVQSACGK